MITVGRFQQQTFGLPPVERVEVLPEVLHGLANDRWYVRREGV